MAAKRPPKRLPPNIVSEAIVKAGGRSAVQAALHVSAPTLHRWRRDCAILDGIAAMRLAELVETTDAKRWQLAKRLAGID